MAEDNAIAIFVFNMLRIYLPGCTMRTCTFKILSPIFKRLHAWNVTLKSWLQLRNSWSMHACSLGVISPFSLRACVVKSTAHRTLPGDILCPGRAPLPRRAHVIALPLIHQNKGNLSRRPGDAPSQASTEPMSFQCNSILPLHLGHIALYNSHGILMLCLVDASFFLVINVPCEIQLS